MKLMNERAQVQEAAEAEAKPCAWMGPHVPLGNGSNWRRLEQDYEFSDGYGLKEPGDGWTPLYDKAAIAAAVAAERERCAKLCEAARPPGGRAWDAEQGACFDALTHVADAIRRV